jgi:hypothetical protein
MFESGFVIVPVAKIRLQCDAITPKRWRHIMDTGRGMRLGISGRPSSSANRVPWALHAVVGVVALVATFSAAQAVDARNPANDIAEIFSRATDGAAKSDERQSPAQPSPTAQTPAASVKPPPAAGTTEQAQAERRVQEQQRAYEEEMLARARAEAEARLKADMAREQELARQRAQAEAAARRAQAELFEKRRALEEAQEEARARTEEQLSRAAEEARKQAEAERLTIKREREAQQLAERLRAARRAREEARIRKAAEAEASKEAAERLEHAREILRLRKEQLANRIATIKADRQRQQKLADTHTKPDKRHNGVSSISTGTAHPRSDMTANQTGAGTSREPHHATILLVMKPGNRGIRRWKKTADPMLCMEGSCYISDGAGSPARRLTRREGFGPGVALGTRAGACNNKLHCIFRNVDLKADIAWMQPVDLRIVRHDRREARRVSADPTCMADRGHLTCDRTIEATDYRAWVIPEHIAQRAGSTALEAALRERLAGNVMARSPQH